MLFLISSKVFILTLFNKKFGLLFLQLTNIEQLFVFGKYLHSELRKKTNFTLAEVILFFLVNDKILFFIFSSQKSKSKQRRFNDFLILFECILKLKILLFATLIVSKNPSPNKKPRFSNDNFNL